MLFDPSLGGVGGSFSGVDGFGNSLRLGGGTGDAYTFIDQFDGQAWSFFGKIGWQSGAHGIGLRLGQEPIIDWFDSIQQDNAAFQNEGANESAFFPFVGGSTAGTYDTVPHPETIWKNEPLPWIGFLLEQTNGQNIVQIQAQNTEASYSNMIFRAGANGIFKALTNAGIPPVAYFDTGWQGQHRVGGFITNDVLKFPSGISNYVAYIHTNNWRAYVNLYFQSASVPLSGDTEIDFSMNGNEFTLPSGDSVNGFLYPSQAALFGTNWVHPTITADTVWKDIHRLYQFDWDGVIIQDMSTLSLTWGYNAQLARQFSWAVQNSGALYSKPQSQFTNSNYATHNMAWGIYNDCGTEILPYECNDFNIDAFTSDRMPLQGSFGTTYAMNYVRSYLNLYVAGMPSHGPHLIITDNNNSQFLWSTNDYTGYFAVGCFFQGDIANTFVQPPNMVTVLTNIPSLLALHQDSLENFPVAASNGGTNGVWVKKMSNGSFDVLYENESATTATNLGVTWASFGVPNGTLFQISNLLSSQLFTSVTNTFTNTIAANSASVWNFTLLSPSLNSSNNFSGVNTRTNVNNILNGCVSANAKFANIFNISNAVQTVGGNAAFIATDRSDPTVTAFYYVNSRTAKFFSPIFGGDFLSFNLDTGVGNFAVTPTAPGFYTTSTNRLTFTSVSSFTNTLGRNATASISAGTSVAITDTNGVAFDTIGTIATLHILVPMNPNMRSTGTTVSAIVY